MSSTIFRPDGIRVLPVIGVGGLQNLKDVLFLKGIDMGIVDQDNMALLKKRDPKLYADIEQRVHYITKLYNAELHVLARNDIKSLADLKGKRVNFNVKEHQTEVTGDHLFAMLNIPVEKTNYDVDESIRRLLSGDLAAIMIVTGAPQAALAKLKKEDGLHFVPVDQDSLPGVDFTPALLEYLPAEFTSKTYPNLVPEGTSVPTIANRALLVTYAWPEGSSRYNRVAKFVNEFFGKIDEFHSPSRHPKWAEINLWADIPGWTTIQARRPVACLSPASGRSWDATCERAAGKRPAGHRQHAGEHEWPKFEPERKRSVAQPYKTISGK